MPTPSEQLFSWSESIDALEITNPLAFDYFYHFHSMNGLREGNLSPYRRLVGIGDFCESSSEKLTEDFLYAITDRFSIDREDMNSYYVSEEGFHFF
jgi:hypothetical protein